MTLFVMDASVSAQLHALADYAEQNRFELPQLLARANKAMNNEPVEPLPSEYSVTLPSGFGVTYTIEQHPSGWLRHLSVSSPRADRVPIAATMEFIMGELGFTKSFEDAKFKYPEAVDDGRTAINVLEPIVGNQQTSRAMN